MAENALILYSPSVSATGFTSDGSSWQVTATDYSGATTELTGFEAPNVQQYDLGEKWISNGFTNPVTAAGYDFYHINIRWDYVGGILTAHGFVILSHNFGEVYDFFSGLIGGTASYYIQTSRDNFSITEESYNITELRDNEVIVHRPNNVITRPDWRIQFIGRVTEGIDVSGMNLEIGRAFFSSETDSFQPSLNYRSDWQSGRHDPSFVSLTEGRARRVVEEAQYRSVNLPFEKLPPVDWGMLRTIYERHGVKKPLFVMPRPHLIKTGTNNPSSTDFDPDAMYGYFDPIQNIARSRANDYGTTDFLVNEARG